MGYKWFKAKGNMVESIIEQHIGPDMEALVMGINVRMN